MTSETVTEFKMSSITSTETQLDNNNTHLTHSIPSAVVEMDIKNDSPNRPLELRSSSAATLGYQSAEENSCVEDHTNQIATICDTAESGHSSSSSPPRIPLALTENDLHLSPNIFSKLTMFFHENSNVRILMSLLEDMLARKLYKLDVIINDLEHFQKNSKDLNIKNAKTCEMRPVTVGRAYVFAVCKTANRYPNHISEAHLDKLADLVLNQQDCFEEVVVDLCKHESKYFKTQKESKCNMVLIFEACLRKLNADRNLSIDSSLSWGETPLSLAARFRCPSMVHILLNYGASIWVSWLNFNSVLEVLLFSPHIILLGDSEKEKILRCLDHVLPAMGQVRLPIRHGELVEPNGMSPFLKDWRHLIPSDQSVSPCSLKHLSKLQIRDILRQQRLLPDGIQQLPFPHVIKQYMKLV